MIDLLIGNGLSLVAACFTAASNWTTDKAKCYMLQAWQCGILAIASIFFHSYAGISTLALCALRNYLIGKNKYTWKLCVILTILIGVVGVLVNNRGFVGILLVLATMVYSVGSYVVQRPMAMKLNILINQLCWMIYEIVVLDIVSLITEIITVAVLMVSIVKLWRKQ